MNENDIIWDDDDGIMWDDVKQPEYVSETPELVEADPFIAPTELPIGAEDRGNATATPFEIQEREVADFRDAQADDISRTLAEVQQATSTMADTLGASTDATKAQSKFVKEATRVLEDKGYTVQNRGGEKVIIGKDGTEYPFESGMMDALKASTGEVLGSIGAGALGGTVAGGPVGTVLGGLAGGALGAMGGDYLDTSRNAEKYGIEVTPEERKSRAVDVGLTDAAGGVIGAGLGKLIGKGISKVLPNKYLQEFTTIAELPSKEREAIRHLAEQSGLSDEQMEQYIKEYAGIVKEPITPGKALEVAAKSSEREQLGYAIEAMKQSPQAKKVALDEATKRSETVGSVLERDPELADLYARRTINDEGRRKATNWSGLYDDLVKSGMQEGDPILDYVGQQAKAIGTKDTDMFQAVVRPIKPDDAAASWIEPWAGTERGAFSTQKTAGIIGQINEKIKQVFPSADTKTVKMIAKAMEEGMTPKELEEELVGQGLERVQAKRFAEQLPKAQKAFDPLIKEQEKEGSTIAKGIESDLKEFNTAKKQLVKDQAAELKEAKEQLNRYWKDWDAENLTGKKIDPTLRAKLREARRRALKDMTSPTDDTGLSEVVRLQKQIEEPAESVIETGVTKPQPRTEAEIHLKGSPDDNPAVIRSKYAKANTPPGGDADAFREEGESIIRSNKNRREQIEREMALAEKEAYEEAEQSTIRQGHIQNQLFAADKADLGFEALDYRANSKDYKSFADYLSKHNVPKKKIEKLVQSYHDLGKEPPKRITRLLEDKPSVMKAGLKGVPVEDKAKGFKRSELGEAYLDWVKNQKTAKQGDVDFFTKSKRRRNALGITAQDVIDFYGETSKIPKSIKNAYDIKD